MNLVGIGTSMYVDQMQLVTKNLSKDSFAKSVDVDIPMLIKSEPMRSILPIYLHNSVQGDF